MDTPPLISLQSDALRTQTGLNEVSAAQSRLNATLGAELDRTNKQFYTTEDIRQAQAIGGETRATLQTQGNIDMAKQAQALIGQYGLTGQQIAGQYGLTSLTGSQERATQAQLLSGQAQQIGLTGEQQRAYGAQQLSGQFVQTGLSGEQQRLLAQTTGQEGRKTLLQQQIMDNYVANRNRDWSQQAYRVAGGQQSTTPFPSQPPESRIETSPESKEVQSTANKTVSLSATPPATTPATPPPSESFSPKDYESITTKAFEQLQSFKDSLIPKKPEPTPTPPAPARNFTPDNPNPQTAEEAIKYLYQTKLGRAPRPDETQSWLQAPEFSDRSLTSDEWSSVGGRFESSPEYATARK